MSEVTPLRFYVSDRDTKPVVTNAIMTGLDIATWSPRDKGPWPKGLPQFQNRIWKAFDRLRIFETAECGVLIMRIEGALIHRSLVTPRWHRFPDMGPNDLQIGAVWTDPDYRGRGLARLAISEIRKRWTGRYQCLWYIVDETNEASIRTIEASDFKLIGLGAKTCPFGIGLLGQYRMTKRNL
jgi:RimJ/RimL family protein N-acetyltransferase